VNATLVDLFEEATALARDETLDDAERGRRLVDLLGETDTRRVRLTHQYGPKMAADLIATREELGPWRLEWPELGDAVRERPGTPLPDRTERTAAMLIRAGLDLAGFDFVGPAAD
jgi:hypothetical protein